MATFTDYTSLDLTGEKFLGGSEANSDQGQWFKIARAVQGLAVYFQNGFFAGIGAELAPNNFLKGLAFGDGGGADPERFQWRLFTDGTDFLIQENSANDASPTWTTRVTVSGGSGIDHGGLTGLGDDDHTQYFPLTAVRNIAPTGNNVNIVKTGDAALNLVLQTGSTADQNTLLRYNNRSGTVLFEAGFLGADTTRFILRETGNTVPFSVYADGSVANDILVVRNGIVGIGVASPLSANNTKLHVNSGTHAAIRVSSGAAANESGLDLYNTTTQQWRIYKEGTSQDLIIRDQPNTTNAMIFDATNSRIGIRTASPQVDFDVERSAIGGHEAITITGNAITLDFLEANTFEVDLDDDINSGNITISNIPDSGTFCVIFTQDNVGGNTVATDAWPAVVQWAGGTAPTITSAADAVDVITFLVKSNGDLLGVVSQDFS